MSERIPSGIEVGVRRGVARSPDPGSDPELVGRLRAEIEREGRITFARFMERALYEPEHGYYRRPTPGPGRAGDFLTAPELHPIFGRAVARQLDEVWQRLDRPASFVLREHGAGEGALAVAILDGLVAERSDLLDAVEVEPVEIEAARLAAFRTRLEAAGHGSRTRASTDARIDGTVIANEVLDALPVHRVEWRDGKLRELYVTWTGDGFGEEPGDPSTPALAERLAAGGAELGEGQRAEIALGVEGWVARAAAGLRRGLLLLIDYGHPAADLYGPRRRAGTLAAYVGHRVHEDPFINVGRQDLTAHVDFSAVDRAAATAGLASAGNVSQAEFLAGLGIEELLREAQADPAQTLETYTLLRSAVMRLLDPAATGGFRVLGFARGMAVEPPLRGFGWRLPARRHGRTG